MPRRDCSRRRRPECDESQIDDEEHEVTNKPVDRQHVNAEEVGRCDRAPRSLQEHAPRQCLAPARAGSMRCPARWAGSWSEPRRSRGRAALRPGECSPERALAGHRRQLRRHVARRRRSPRRAPRLRTIVLRRDHPTVPAQNRLGRREGPQLGQHGPAEPPTLLARSRRSASVNRKRPVPRRSRSSRFSACSYAMASCCLRWIQPAIRRTRNWNGTAGFGGLTAGHDSRRRLPRPEGAAIAKALRFSPAQLPDRTTSPAPSRSSRRTTAATSRASSSS